MTSSRDLRFLRIAVCAGLFGALALAGCGRKGGLDPPPAAVADPAVMAQPGPGAPDAAPPANGPPVAGPRRRTPLDWLLD